MRTETATAIRDRASRRVRRITAFAIAGATALTAAFTGIAAGSTHTKSTSKQSSSARTPAAPAAQRTVTAPVPSLSSNGASVTPPSQPQQQPAVTPTAQQPVVVSGGS
jgi:hypothetical protein